MGHTLGGNSFASIFDEEAQKLPPWGSFLINYALGAG